uniref:tetratricopeptide repeat protein n=1 Tax=Scytonema sp. PCC 10023 TaxID=1680591 RepID=UPI0039C6E30F
MPVITIREEGKTETGFEATLRFAGEEYFVTITEPFTTKEEKELEWYFEEWLEFPFSDTTIAQRAAASIKKYGENLFNQVFTDRSAYSEYQQLRKGQNPLQIEIVGKTPEFQALHWEALWEPGFPRPLAVDCVMVRKSIKRGAKQADVPQSPVINLLVVTARPNEEQDVGYRTISRPLIEAIENSQLAVNVELLRPGTYEALARHLEEKGAGFYHIIHFDAHGALMRYQEIHNEATAKPYAYQVRWGRYDLQRYDGVKAFLFLEGETKGNADPVEATELANLLTGKGIPVCLLNACQSGKQVKNPTPSPSPPAGRGARTAGDVENDYRETSLGSQLMAAGMQMVAAMGYTVTVDAAKLMMQRVYTSLFDNKEITEAIRLGRLELFHDKKRKAYFNQEIDLEDWLLPVVYSNQAVKFNLREFTPQEEEQFWQSEGERYHFTPPEYGFFGRDLEILKIEKSLLRHNILLLQGMGGTGKTTLLRYLRQWWQRTGFAKDVFYFGYDEKAWNLEQIIWEIGNQIYDRFDNFHRMVPEAKKQKLLKTLRAESYILILDNLESVTGQPLAIQNTLPEAERNQIKDFLTRLVGGETRVMLGSRSREDWLQALQISIEFNDRYSCARTYHHLGYVAQELREFEEARRNYQQALQISIEFNDRYSCACTYHQLGFLAQELREFEEARRNYQQALQIYIEFGDRYSCASTYHQLGMVALKLREFEEARRNYQQALQISIEFNDRYSCACTYHQLGFLAQELREFEEARRNYQQALQIY